MMSKQKTLCLPRILHKPQGLAISVYYDYHIFPGTYFYGLVFYFPIFSAFLCLIHLFLLLLSPLTLISCSFKGKYINISYSHGSLSLLPYWHYHTIVMNCFRITFFFPFVFLFFSWGQCRAKCWWGHILLCQTYSYLPYLIPLRISPNSPYVRILTLVSFKAPMSTHGPSSLHQASPC